MGAPAINTEKSEIGGNVRLYDYIAALEHMKILHSSGAACFVGKVVSSFAEHSGVGQMKAF